MSYVRITIPAYTAALLAGIAVAAAATIVATEGGMMRAVYVAKPLTTVLIIALAVSRRSPVAGYKGAVVAALAFSLAGDVLLMLPRDRFVAGLAAFLIAHLLYIYAFTRTGVHARWWIAVPFALYAAALLRVLLPHLDPGLKVPVIVYAAALSVMAWQACERAASVPPGNAAARTAAVGAIMAAAGAALFVASDSALAVNRFVGQFRGADALVLGTYFAAQTLIALSVA
jgi:uncharacterized membrane protein YhhN